MKFSIVIIMSITVFFCIFYIFFYKNVLLMFPFIFATFLLFNKC